MKDEIKVGIAQISPSWLNREDTITKVLSYIEKAAKKDCTIVVFGEALIPGYPFWIELTDGARFNSPVQKEIFSYYMTQAVSIPRGDLKSLSLCCLANSINAVIGIIELAADRGNHSLYCSRVFINDKGEILSTHRKLMPTYEERLVWSPGDGNGLQVHPVGPFTVGSLNCWENWMPLPRTALYALGEDLHIALWPGSIRNTEDITRFIAKESRSYVISVSGIMKKKDISNDIPHAIKIKETSPDTLADGGSCLAAPDGEWVIKPGYESEELLSAVISHEIVRQERQNFDPSGHYSRPDITALTVNRKRQSIINLSD